MQQIALVTGAGRGLGSALVASLLERGWCVFAGQYRPDWPELSALARRFPGALHIVPLEVRSVAPVQAAALSVSTLGDHLEPEEAAVPALEYFLQARDDEHRLVMRDRLGREWPW